MMCNHMRGRILRTPSCPRSRTSTKRTEAYTIKQQQCDKLRRIPYRAMCLQRLRARSFAHGRTGPKGTPCAKKAGTFSHM